MKKTAKLLISLVLIGAMTAGASMATDVKVAIRDTAQYVQSTVKSPQVGSVGGEWAVLGLARSGEKVPQEYFDRYYNTVVDYVKACKGVLHEKKYTEYSRLVLTMTAMGRNPADVGGYNLLTALGDYEKTIWQGINGPIWALLALDSGSYAMPKNEDAKTQATREMYVNRILELELGGGGFSLTGAVGDKPDPDVTAMVLQALAKYQSRDDVKKLTQRTLKRLSEMQDSDGGYASWGVSNSESVVQVIVALNELKIPLDDAGFVKNGKTTLDNLLSYHVNGGGFLHAGAGAGSNQMATEQGLYALASVARAGGGKPSLYSMSDVTPIEDILVEDVLPGKHKDVKKSKILELGKTFADIEGHPNQVAIEALAARGIITGKEGGFVPNGTMSRAEFATIIVRALGLAEKKGSTFLDVAAADWFSSFVGTAVEYKIVDGVGGGRFNPSGTIKKQEGAKMTAAAAALCGLDTEMSKEQSVDILALFPDYVKADEWAWPGLAFCYSNDILPEEDEKISPLVPLKRCEIAQMVYNMLSAAKLI